MLTFHVVMERYYDAGTGKRQIRFTGRRDYIRQHGHQQLNSRKVRQGTLVVETNGEGAIINFGASFCSPMDQFVRKQGRIRATGRMSSKESKYSEINGVTPEQVLDAVNTYVFDVVGCH